MRSRTAETRARTAMRRRDVSVPGQHLLILGVLTGNSTYLDYGCGRGDDVATFRTMGIDACGWDPVHSPATRRIRCDVVSCNYVVNVIDEPRERRHAIEAAWGLTRRTLLVSARLNHEQDGAHTTPRGDGWITSRGTFQKFFEHTELGDLVELATQTVTDAVAPGIFVVFRSEVDRQQWKARRMRAPASPRLTTRSSQQLQAHQDVLGPMMEFVLEHGRLPTGEEIEDFREVSEIFGSMRAAFQVVVRATDRDAWKAAARERSIELLAFLALAQFDDVDKMGKLPPVLQRDTRAHFGSFKNAHEMARRLLFSSGNAVAVDLACRASSVGKLTPTALYVHRSAVAGLPALLRVVLGCGQRLVGDIDEANVFKIFRMAPEVSYLEYPEFDSNPHPWLNRTWHLDLHSQKMKTTSFGARPNRPILHRLHEFLLQTDPRFIELRELTDSEVRKGFYEDPSTIGTEDGWRKTVDGHIVT
jgi:DNA phosphorothioation-associated putative methyltransferase